MSTIDEIGERDNWRCWVCDLPVDPNASVNDDLGPSLDRCEVFAKPISKKKTAPADERLAHRQCNTKKGAIKPVISWPEHLILFDPAPIVQLTERLINKGGRELIARCASQSDAKDAADWITDRLSRLVPDTVFTTKIEQGGGQFLLSLLSNSR
jgi:hypothetical protein